jgi:hypothetical protein
MTVNMVTLHEPKSWANRTKLTTPKNDVFARHSAIYHANHKSFGYILRYLYGSEIMLSGVVIGKCEMPSTDISQENDHAKLIVKRQFVAYNFRKTLGKLSTAPLPRKASAPYAYANNSVTY